MFAKSIIFVFLSFLLSLPCAAATIDSKFSNSDYMFDCANSLLFENRDETAANLLKLAQEKLADAKKAQEEQTRLDTAMEAWFAAVYADMQNNLPYSAKNAALQKQIDACVANAGKLLGISGKDNKYINPTLDFLKGKLPDRCGINKGVVPVTGDINMIILDDGIGQTRTMYYHKLQNGEPDCGEIRGSICFQILNAMPVTPAMRQSGVQGDSMTFIDQCVSPD